MRKTKVILIGYETFKSKKGNICVSIHVSAPLLKREAHIECVGQKATHYFVSEDLKSKISVTDVGKEITICTVFFNGKDNLIDIAREETL